MSLMLCARVCCVFGSFCSLRLEVSRPKTVKACWYLLAQVAMSETTVGSRWGAMRPVSRKFECRVVRHKDQYSLESTGVHK